MASRACTTRCRDASPLRPGISRTLRLKRHNSSSSSNSNSSSNSSSVGCSSKRNSTALSCRLRQRGNETAACTGLGEVDVNSEAENGGQAVRDANVGAARSVPQRPSLKYAQYGHGNFGRGAPHLCYGGFGKQRVFYIRPDGNVRGANDQGAQAGGASWAPALMGKMKALWQMLITFVMASLHLLGDAFASATRRNPD